MIDFTEGSQMRTNASGSPKTQKPNIIPKGQMTNQQPPAIIEIGGVKYQRIVEKKPQTLFDALLDDFDWEERENICKIVERWMSQYECDYVVCAEYLQGYNALMETLKAYLK